MRVRLHARLGRATLAAAVLSGLFVVASPIPAGAVVQDGPKNYAGPACPGADWDCTTDTQSVVQTSDGGENRFVCNTDACSVEQTNTTGSNSVDCTQSTAAGIFQTCAFKQTNGSGPNSVTANQSADVPSGAVPVQATPQSSSQSLTGTQDSADGDNTITVTQLVKQTSSVIGLAATQSQEARQLVDTEQRSTSGDQTLNIDQDEVLKADAQALIVTQTQNAADAGPNQDADIFMRSTSGVNTVNVDQDQDFDQNVTGLLGLVLLSSNQTQGSDTGGIDLLWDVDSLDGSSTVTDSQTKDWFQDSPGGLLGRTQLQNDGLRIAGLGLTPEHATSSQLSTLVNDGVRLCRQAQDVFAKIQATGTQNCNNEVVQQASGTHYTMAVECDAEGTQEFDGEGNACTQKETSEEQQENRSPDCSGVEASPNSFLAEDGAPFKTVTLSGESDPDGDATTYQVTKVTQDEPVNDQTGDGQGDPDARLGPAANQVELKAERKGNGDGRVYEISYTVTDSNGASCNGKEQVSVPHSGNGQPAVDSGQNYNSLVPAAPA